MRGQNTITEAGEGVYKGGCGHDSRTMYTEMKTVDAQGKEKERLSEAGQKKGEMRLSRDMEE